MERKLDSNGYVAVEISEVIPNGENWFEVSKDPPQFDFEVGKTSLQIKAVVTIAFLVNLFSQTRKSKNVLHGAPS